MKPKVKKGTVLIMGVSSFIGSNLAEHFKDDYKVIGTYHNTPIEIDGVLCVPCDVLVKAEVQSVLYAFRPDVTIYCAGISSVMECARREEFADALNTSGLFNVAEYCQRYKSQICYISSGYVFGGEDKNYLEMDIPDAITTYGRTQAAAEFYIQKTSLNYLIFRCSRVYGRGINPSQATWFELMQKKLTDGQSTSMDDNVQVGFLDVAYLSMIIRICIEKNVSNRLLQVSTKDAMTHYNFAKKYAQIFSVQEDLITRSKWALPLSKNNMRAGSGDKLAFKLDISNIEGYLNIDMPSIEESLKFTLKRLQGSSVDTTAKKSSRGEGIKFI
tara:strand:+ start:310 stop:1296 length:987 start_codon:yes stop_codon:yes gene_type:complete